MDGRRPTMTNSVVRTVKPAAERRNTGRVDALELEDVLMGMRQKSAVR